MLVFQSLYKLLRSLAQATREIRFVATGGEKEAQVLRRVIVMREFSLRLAVSERSPTK